MGYTHYWTQTRDLSADEWQEISTDIGDILKYVEHVAGVPLGDWNGAPRSRPQLDADAIGFNGIGEDGHETFLISRKRDAEHGAFCKTARKPYDLAVTACLCYLSSCLDTPAYRVSSDGNGHNFLDGLEAARQALPRKANTLDVPRGVMEQDRWTGPWISHSAATGYEIHACINGKAYVTRNKDGAAYCFPTHLAFAQYLDRTKEVRFAKGGTTGWGDYGKTEPNIWSATGSFDQARHARIARAQKKLLAALFPVPPENAEAPPAFVRPMDFPRPEDNGTFCYSFDELLKKHAA